MLKKLLQVFAFLFCGVGFSVAQTYPPYTINVCDTASKGYYFLCAVKYGPANGPAPTRMILDDKGRVIFYDVISNGSGDDFKVQPNGQMSYDYHNKFFIMDSTFTIVDSVKCKNGIYEDGHDMQILPNGHFLMLGFEQVVEDLSADSMFNGNHSPGNTQATVKCGVIQEQDANKNVVFEWHTKDHYTFSDVSEAYLWSPIIVDWTHCNAVELDNDGNILLSMRHFNEITKINRSDSSIMWRLGGKGNQFTFTNDTDMFLGQHDIRRIPNGNITLFDNGAAGPPFHAGAGKEYQLDESQLTATLAWEYVESPGSFSQATGNTQRLPNGNTMIDFGITPQEPRVCDVVNPAGNKIFEIQFQDTMRSYRTFNYPTLPWHMPRPQITCTMIGNQAYLDAGSGHSSYLWSTGATTQMIPVTTADTFSVFVPIGSEGFIRSEYFIVTNVNNPCSPAGVENPDDVKAFSVFPNPANGQLSIQSVFEQNKKVIVEIFDFTGKKISSSEAIPSGNQITIPVADLSSGIYLVRVNGVGGKFVKM